jgi:hypothetical protein
MARYSPFLGRFVDVQYRAGDICLPASGTFVGDSGRSIFLEQHYEQHGQQKNFRWEIPYECIVRLAPAKTTRTPSTYAPVVPAFAESNSGATALAAPDSLPSAFIAPDSTNQDPQEAALQAIAANASGRS